MLSHRDNVGDPATVSRMLTEAINNFVMQRESHSKPVYIAPADMFCPKVASLDFIIRKCDMITVADTTRYSACEKLRDAGNMRFSNFSNALAVNHWLNTEQSGVAVRMADIITPDITKSYDLLG